MPRLRGGGRGGARSDRAVEVEGLAGVQEGHRREAEGVSGAGPLGYDVVALVLDGKSFAEDEMVVALGVTLEGDKVFLGFVQTDTENAVVIRSFLRGLKDRGLDLSAGAPLVIDGAKGLRSGVLAAFKDQVLLQRCQWHKRENVISHLPRAEQKNWRRRLQRAYQRPTYKEAAQALKTLKHELGEVTSLPWPV